MRIDGKMFDGSESYHTTNQLLQSRIGTGMWMTEYIPKNYDNKIFMEYYHIMYDGIVLCDLGTISGFYGRNARFIGYNNIIRCNN